MPPRASVSALTDSVSVSIQAPGGWYQSNSGWIRGADGGLLIDTCATEGLTRRLLAAVDADLGARPLTLALTHAHGDHANGAGAVRGRGGTVLARTATAHEVKAGPHTFPQVFDCSVWGDIDPPADITEVEAVQAVDLGGRVPEIHPVPVKAHTAGDLVVWDSADGVLFTGDLLFVGVCPLAIQGNVRGWLEVLLGWLPAFEAKHLVPGHGPAVDRAAVTPLVDYFQWLIEVTDKPEPDFAALYADARDRWPDWLDSERHAVNLLVAHAESRGAEPDLMAAITALMTTNGGRIVLDL
ncbi:MBL fold metallo-hydrolase [Actinokineospora sp. HUAS TT18]|uniref:MBL fold metallo-hydrolase n=1 Tax=Actinokineospora sp. HUAS TT18 TaxID=3447451 RepID=UPI003F51FE77